MNNTDFFLNPIQTVHFLSLFTYINKLSDIFYEKELIRRNERRQPYPIVNALYQHLDNAKNETEAKQRLVEKLLEGSELYGGNKNQTLDIGYVNETLDYIVSNAVFAQTGNLYGYLAEVVTLAESLKVSAFKKTVLEQLSYLRHLNDDGNVSNLTHLARVKIAETLLWPLFPDSSNNTEIISVKYIYAQAGYNLAKSAQMNLTDIPFSRYMTLGMTIEASAIGEKLPKPILRIFALPAMLYYAYNQTVKFRGRTTKHLIKDEDFWSEALLILFSHLDSTFERIENEALETNLIYQFNLAMSVYKNRTAIARDVIHKECENLNESSVESLIDDYKTYSASTNCYKGGKKLPNLELLYEAQFPKMKEKYRLMEIDFIREAFDKFPSLRSLMDGKAIVYRSYPIPNDMRCNMCAPNLPSYHPNIDFFAIKSEGEKEYYALEQNENNVTLLIQKDNDDFNKRVGLPEGRKLELAGFIKIYKRDEEDFEKFVQTFAEIKAEEFRNKLFEYGYNRTSMEKFFEIVKSFIPFYHCVKLANAGQPGPAILSCFGDAASFIPLAGLLGVGVKVTTVTAGRFLLASGLTLKTFTLRQAFLATMAGLKEAALSFSVMLTKVVLTKQMFKSVSMGIVRSLDPGFEVLGRLTWHGGALIGKVISKNFRRISKKFPLLNFKHAKYESIWLHLTEKSVNANDMKIILSESKLDGHEVFRYIYPGGDHPFGPKYIRLSKGYAEMKRMIGFDKEIPVVVTRVTKRGRVVYKKVNLQTEEPFGLELKINRNNILEIARQPFRKHIYNIKTEGLGGRGALMVKREKCIYDAAEMVLNANIGVGQYQARTTLKHYVLTINDPNSVDDLANLNIDLENVGDLEFNDFMKDLFTDIDDLNAVALEKYFPVPSYNDFALDWIRTRQINPRYDEFYISHPNALQELFYNERLMIKNSYREARDSIISIYGQHFFKQTNVEITDAYAEYHLVSAYKHVTFEDFYALLAWRKINFLDVKDISLASLLQKALHKLAVRQSFKESAGLRRVLYHIELRVPLPIEQNLANLKGKTLKSEKIHLSSSEEEIHNQLLILDDSKFTEGTETFLYEVHLDCSYLMTDLNEVLSITNGAVLLPSVPYQIHSAEKAKFAGVNVNHMILHNIPIAKETFIAQLMKIF